MVYITPEQYDEAYAKIVNESIGRTNSILILVAADPDALCSLKILLSLLRNDSVTYNMVPVSGYADLVRINRTWFRPDVPGAAPGAPPAPLASLLLPYPDLRSVICLNCGATADLADLFQLPPDVTLYVMDSHRPFHLRNLYGNPQVVIFDDGETDESLQIVRQAFERLERLENGEESGSVGSGSKRPRSLVNDVDNDDDGEGLTMSLVHRAGDGNGDDQDPTQPSLPPARRRRTGMDTDVSVDADASFDHANDDDDNGPDGNSSDQDPDGINQLPKRACRLIIAEHYQRGQYYGQATAVTLYILALQLSRETTDMLWFAIVGLTHQFLLDHIDEEDYWGQVQIYTDEVERLFPTVVAGAGDGESGNLNGNGGGIGEYGDVNEAAKKGDGSGDTMDRTHPGGLATAVVDPHPDVTAVDPMTTGDAVPRNMPVKRVTQPHGICYSEEFKFMLLRHWSLYESMQYS
ncbi:DNA replication initiation factor cdc45, partial [Tieghemiomyces parasiticus]